MYEEVDIDKAYETFLSIFKSSYDKNCPLKQCNRKQNYREKPWITKGLQNACKKNNTLYREFIKYRRQRQKINIKDTKIS